MQKRVDDAVENSETVNTGNAKRLYAVVIPALNPDARLLRLVDDLRRMMSDCPVIVVDDGSGAGARTVFSELLQRPGVTVLHHPVNRGKGAALKTAFRFFLAHFPGGAGVVTADADGQHLPEDIAAVAAESAAHADALVLGCREVAGAAAPWKSRIGNVLTRGLFTLLSGGVRLADTQTGLRGIPRRLLETLLECPGERFEFETAMLFHARDRRFGFREQRIATVYRDANRETHFDPFRDSVRIYAVLGRRLVTLSAVRFCLSAVASAVIDVGLFALLFHIVLPAAGIPRLIGAVVGARVVSSLFNYWCNRNVVFHNGGRRSWDWVSLLEYYELCAVIAAASYWGIRLALWLFPGTEVVWLKILVDTVLFIGSFLVQRWWIFRPGREA